MKKTIRVLLLTKDSSVKTLSLKVTTHTQALVRVCVATRIYKENVWHTYA